MTNFGPSYIPDRRQHCRCTKRKCQKRVVINKQLDRYVRPPKCNCGAPLRVDKYNDSRPWRLNTCHCDAYWFPHNAGRGDCERERKVPKYGKKQLRRVPF